MASSLGLCDLVWPMASPSSVSQLHVSPLFPILVFLKSWQILTEILSMSASVPDFTRAALLITEFLDNEYKVVSLLPSTTSFQTQAHLQVAHPYLPACLPTLLAIWLPQKHPPPQLVLPCRALVAKTGALSPLSESSFQGACLRKKKETN